MDVLSQLNLTLKASQALNLLHDDEINAVLNEIADAAVKNATELLSENRKDLARMDLENPKYDRLQLTEKRIHEIASGIHHVASLPSPVGKILRDYTHPNGMHIQKVSVPFGVIGIIYEARPNVTLDVFSLCFKSGNACVLKGGSDAEFSNKAIVKIIHEVLAKHHIDTNIVALLPVDRESTAQLLTAHGLVDLIIPRGSKNLIEFVRSHATIPVIETGAGICHAYFDEFGDAEKGMAIVNNAKTRRVSVCNALDCLIVHEKRLNDLPKICSLLHDSHVVIYADELSYAALEGKYPADLLKKAVPESYGTEFLDYKMAVKTVPSFEEALTHIATYGSKHSESIITEDENHKFLFLKLVDASSVYCNVPTSFTDGAQFGLGAEIGISTQKMHARGPMGLEELTTYKWIIEGDGQIRPK